MKSTITVRLSEDLREELEAICSSESMAMSDVVRDSLRRDLAIRKFRRLRSQVLPYAEAQGLLTDEDAFEVMS